MGLGRRLMLLLHWLRHPDQKPPVTDELDRRLDKVDKRLRHLAALRQSYESYDGRLKR